MTQSLDETDLRLLRVLQHDNQLGIDALADRVGRSPSAVARRLKRLRDTQVIVADVSILSDQAVGGGLSAVLLLQLERHALTDVEVFCGRLVDSENVQLCLQVSGAFDVLLLVMVADMAAFNAFVDEKIVQGGMVRRYETSFVKKRMKASLAVPLTSG